MKIRVLTHYITCIQCLLGRLGRSSHAAMIVSFELVNIDIQLHNGHLDFIEYQHKALLSDYLASLSFASQVTNWL